MFEHPSTAASRPAIPPATTAVRRLWASARIVLCVAALSGIAGPAAAQEAAATDGSGPAGKRGDAAGPDVDVVEGVVLKLRDRITKFDLQAQALAGPNLPADLTARVVRLSALRDASRTSRQARAEYEREFASILVDVDKAMADFIDREPAAIAVLSETHAAMADGRRVAAEAAVAAEGQRAQYAAAAARATDALKASARQAKAAMANGATLSSAAQSLLIQADDNRDLLEFKARAAAAKAQQARAVEQQLGQKLTELEGIRGQFAERQTRARNAREKGAVIADLRKGGTDAALMAAQLERIRAIQSGGVAEVTPQIGQLHGEGVALGGNPGATTLPIAVENRARSVVDRFGSDADGAPEASVQPTTAPAARPAKP